MFCVPYASAVGSLMYAMVYTRPYIAHAMGVLSKYMSKTRKGALDNGVKFIAAARAILREDGKDPS
jgi:hypothetical protein